MFGDNLFSAFDDTNPPQKPYQVPEIPPTTIEQEQTHEAPINQEPMQEEELKLSEEEQQEQQQEQPQKFLHHVQPFSINVFSEEAGCIHEVVSPTDFPPAPLKPITNPAKQYKFVLDSFQMKAIQCVENNESVLVSAHTSAGKTVVAEYAIALSLKNKQKVIYTSPIKALSNQKYRELNDEFNDVGLITGDVSLNPNASCIVMTTEIFRSMLYRGSELTREVAWVIFDEVHYMRDKERGVVWEETIILSSPNIRYVFLSATIPNAREFAEWICRIKHQPCHVVYTEFRPVPLQHFVFPSGGEGIYLVVDDKGKFREDNFEKAVGSLAVPVVQGNRGKKKPTEGADLQKLVSLIMKKHFDPVIIFSFSKKEVEAYAMSMAKLDLTTDDEKTSINNVFESAIECLSTEDQQLSQIQEMLPILKRGIGIHHGGLLPIIKEVIEIMFQEGWIKALFSTETFSLGLNMPARTVIFTAMRKFDGTNFRYLTGGEYIQMSGRAGRRGLDDRGTTVLMLTEQMEPSSAKDILSGKSDPLYSSFHLLYNMLLNSLRSEDVDAEWIVARSFLQFQSERAVGEMEKKAEELKGQQEGIEIEKEDIIKAVYDNQLQLISCKEGMKEIYCKPSIIIPYLQIGRLLFIQKEKQIWGWGVFINWNKKKNIKKKGFKKQISEDSLYIVDVMLPVKKKDKPTDELQPASYMDQCEMEVVPMVLETISELSMIKLTLPDDLSLKENRLLVQETMKEIFKLYENKLPLMDPINNMKVVDEKLDQLVEIARKLNLEKQRLIDSYNDDTKLQEQLKIYEHKIKISKSISHLENSIEESQKMVLDNDLQCMKRVLRRLNFINKDDVVQTKGKVACELSTTDEIIITELIFSGIFNDMEPSEIAALLTCLVHDEKSGNDKITVKNEKLRLLFSVLIEQGKKIHKIYVESKINIDEQEYLSAFKPHLIDCCFAWCNGQTFAEIAKMTEVFEGSIVRAFKRVDELLKQMADATKTIGNTTLQEKFTQASEKIRKGIIFAASLYL